MRGGVSQEVLRHEFRFGGVANPVVEPARHGFGDGAYGFGGLPAVAEAEGDLEIPYDGCHFFQVLCGDWSGTDQLGEMAVLLQVFQGGSKELRSHGDCGIQFQVESARDLHSGAGLTDLLIDPFGLAEAGGGGSERDGVATEACEPVDTAFGGEVCRRGE